MKKSPYKTDPNGRLILTCPRCREELSVLDVENYPACPFCDWRFVVDDNLEAFILDPIVRNWVARVSDPANNR